MLEGWRVLTTSSPSHYRKGGREAGKEGKRRFYGRKERKASYQKALYNNPNIIKPYNPIIKYLLKN